MLYTQPRGPSYPGVGQGRGLYQLAWSFPTHAPWRSGLYAGGEGSTATLAAGLRHIDHFLQWRQQRDGLTIPEIKLWLPAHTNPDDLDLPVAYSLQVTTPPFDVQSLPPPPKARDHLTLEFLPQNLDANSIKPDVYFVRLYGNSFPLRESPDKNFHWTINDDDHSKGYLRISAYQAALGRFQDRCCYIYNKVWGVFIILHPQYYSYSTSM